jgi:hypothetical protein
MPSSADSRDRSGTNLDGIVGRNRITGATSLTLGRIKCILDGID